MARLFVVAIGLATLECALVAAFGGFATSDMGGFGAFFALTTAAYVTVGLPLAFAMALLDRAVARLEAVEITSLLGDALGVVLATTAIVITSGQIARADLEYPERVEIPRVLVIGACIAVGVVASRLLRPGIRVVIARAPTLARPRVVLSALLALAALAAFVAGVFALAPVYLTRLAACAGAGSICAALLSARFAVPEPKPRAARACAIAALVTLAAAPIAARSPHGTFVLHDRSPVAGAVAGVLRDLADLDRDGAAPTWLGGADCDEGNAHVGPSVREIPGDGIDQDCRGGDAPARGPEPAEPAPRVAPLACRAAAPISVLLITMDAVRADVITPELTPTLAQLTDTSFAFMRAYSEVPSTVHSLATIFSGKPFSDLGSDNPVAHDVVNLDRPLAQRLRDAHFATAAFNFFVLPPALVGGFDPRAGFGWRESNAEGIKHTFGSAQVTNGALAFARANAQSLFFAWLHYPDAHAPYLDPGDNVHNTATPYEREVAYVDFHLGRLLAELQKDGILDRVVLIVTADHGEDLGERGREGHGAFVYETSIRVPLIVRVPGCGPVRVPFPVSLAQIAPSIGALVGVPIAGLPLWAPRVASDPPVVSEAITQHAFVRTLIGDRYKLMVDVRNGGRALFDLQNDPHETRDIYSAEPAAARDAESAYQRWLDR